MPEIWIGPVRNRLALRRAEKPATKAGQIRALWPEINAALAAGQTAKSIREWLEEDAGIKLGTTSLTSYISRLRREKANCSIEAIPVQAVRNSVGTEPVRAPVSPRQQHAISPNASSAPCRSEDPLAQAIRATAQRTLDIREIHNDGDPRGRKLI
jgi:hypothetical protein